MMKSMTDCINCDDAKAASAALVCVLSCRFASNGWYPPAVGRPRSGCPSRGASVPASRNGGISYERA